MTEIILRTKIKREYGYMYPSGKDENGFLIIYKVKAGRHKKGYTKPLETKNTLPEPLQTPTEPLETPVSNLGKVNYKETTKLSLKEQEHAEFKQEEKDIINWDE